MRRTILVACEYSQRVTKSFRDLGYCAFSCDTRPTLGKAKWHIQADIRTVLSDDWSMLIAFPPCTYLTTANNRFFSLSLHTVATVKKRCKLREDAFNFVMLLANAPIPLIAVENPTGYLNTHYRKPDQIIHPYLFGDPHLKRTCLWLKGLPCLIPTNPVDYPKPVRFSRAKKALHRHETLSLRGTGLPTRSRLRELTFPGIARAMASQWGSFLKRAQ